MNVKYFFVKNIYDYIQNLDVVLELEGVKNNPQIQELIEAAVFGDNKNLTDYVYQELLKATLKNDYKNISEIYEGELFGETEIENLKIDFNFGLRLDIPRGNFHARISDFETETIFFDEDISDCRLISSENYFINWRVEIFHDGEKIFEHVLDLEKQNVLIVFSDGVIGDNLAVLPYVGEFQKKYSCDLKIFAPKHLQDLIKNFYPEIEQVEKITQDFYATFYIKNSMNDILSLPVNPRTIPLEKIGEFIFGIYKTPAPLNFTPTQERKIPEKYVCISIQGSGTPKGWHYPKGWEIICDYLKKLGYRVLCIDKNDFESAFGYENKIPKNAENFCGDVPLLDRTNMLYYADFFIGLSSGLSWLANAVGCEVIMICGFSETWYEFFTPYRVKNNFVCGGCFNDISVPPFRAETFCKKFRGTERELECQKKISPRQVIQEIDNLIADKNLKIPVAE